jgi:hypothetical protein
MMGRPKSQKSAPKHVEPEDASQDVPDEPAASVIEPSASGKAMSKSGAVKAAMEDGLESNEDIAGFAKSRYGLEIAATHISAEKSRLKKKGGVTVTVRARRGRPPGSGTAAKPGRKPASVAQLDQVVKTIQPKMGSGVVADLAAVKALVEKLGVDEVIEIAKLFG